MSHIVVKGDSRQYTNKKTGELSTFHNYTVVDLDDGNCIMIGQAEIPPGVLPDAKVFTCEAVLSVRGFNTKEGRQERLCIKEIRNAKAFKV